MESQGKELHKLSKGNPSKISDFFSGNSFVLFRRYCKINSLVYLYELNNFNFNVLLDESSFGVAKINKIKERYNTFDSFSIEKTDSEEAFNQFPLFTNISKTESDCEAAMPFNSFLISKLDFSVRATNIINEAKLTSIGELLLVTTDKLLSKKNCGKTTIVEIVEKCKDLLDRLDIDNIETEIEEIIPVEQSLKDDFSTQTLFQLPVFSANAIESNKQDLHDSYFGNYKLSHIPFDVRTTNTMHRLKLVILKELLFFPSSSIKLVTGSGNKTIENMHNTLIHFYKVIFSKNKQFESFQEMLTEILSTKPEKLQIFFDRLSSFGKDTTLESIGNKYNITRERVRQIIEKIENLLLYPFIDMQLEEFYDGVDIVLDQYIGAADARKINVDLSELLDWKENISPEVLLNFCSLNNRYRINKQNYLLFSKSNNCNECNKLFEFMKSYFMKESSVTEIEFCEILYQVCQKSCSSFSKSKKYDTHYINWIITENEELNEFCVYDDEEKIYYSKPAWEEKNRSNYSQILKLLESIENSIHMSELVKVVNSELNFNYSQHNLSSLLSRSDGVYLWDRGTLLAKLNFEFPHDFIESKIEDLVFLLEEKKYPVIYINGYFKKTNKECKKHKIPNPTALYSILRDASDPRLTLIKYPNIFLSSTFKGKRNITEEILLFLGKKNNKYNYTSLREYFVNTLGAASYVFQNAIANCSQLEKSGSTISIVNKQSNIYTEEHREVKNQLQIPSLIINYQDMFIKNNVQLTETIKYLLYQLQKKEGSISSIRLHSLSRIKRTNFNTIIFNLNSQFRNIYNTDFLNFENEIWEVNPFFNHPGNWIHKDKTTDKKMNDIELEKDSEDEYPKWLLDQAEKLEDVFKHTATSYKFYWFKAILTLVGRGKKEASFKQMAALMVAHAWKDVLINNRPYTKIDQIPNVVRRIYLDSHLQSIENENSIIEHLYDNLEKYKDIFSQLLVMVPYRFLSTFIVGLTSLKDYRKNEFIESESIKMSLVYKIEKSKIQINADWYKFILSNFDELKKLINKFEKCEES